ncbi:NAD+ synthetase [Candidozyma duobushaemuli]|uniref:NAD(+) synthase (glutamine-hydrolyzing) n=1 Tax=Candidozyma duobushaemuli TaxID=1231522 RepID=A0A2V1AFR7_9ASCO|nr:NAD+ synthetase [[Candida] duobushaemulonis]PVH16920.1 NAD+ synthetase [[Candida] duobushaemulonis]
MSDTDFVTIFQTPLHCKTCIETVDDALKEVSGVKNVDVDLQAQRIAIKGSAPPSAIVKALSNIGKDAIIRGSGKPDSAAVCILESFQPQDSDKPVKDTPLTKKDSHLLEIRRVLLEQKESLTSRRSLSIKISSFPNSTTLSSVFLVLQEVLLELNSYIERLSLADNKMEQLPDELLNVCDDRLKVLDLHCNDLQEFPVMICTCFPRLEFLDVSSNRLKGLPPQVSLLADLRVLHLSNNNFSYLPPTLGELISLERLTVSGNPLVIPSQQTFQSLEKDTNRLKAYLLSNSVILEQNINQQVNKSKPTSLSAMRSRSVSDTRSKSSKASRRMGLIINKAKNPNSKDMLHKSDEPNDTSDYNHAKSHSDGQEAQSPMKVSSPSRTRSRQNTMIEINDMLQQPELSDTEYKSGAYFRRLSTLQEIPYGDAGKDLAKVDRLSEITKAPELSTNSSPKLPGLNRNLTTTGSSSIANETQGTGNLAGTEPSTLELTCILKIARKILFAFSEFHSSIKRLTGFCIDRKVAAKTISLLHNSKSDIDTLVENMENAEERKEENSDLFGAVAGCSFWDDINAFLKAIIQTFSSVKLIMKDAPILNEVRQSMANLTRATKELTILLEASSYSSFSDANQATSVAWNNSHTNLAHYGNSSAPVRTPLVATVGAAAAQAIMPGNDGQSSSFFPPMTGDPSATSSGTTMDHNYFTYTDLLNEEDFKLLHDAPQSQYRLTQRFDESISNPENGNAGYGHGKEFRHDNSVLKKDGCSVKSQPQVQILGQGTFAADEPGNENGEDIVLTHPSHTTFHSDPLTPEQIQIEKRTRFYRWHIDSALYGLSPPKVTTLLGIKVPPATQTQTIDYDDGSGDRLEISQGATCFVSGNEAFERLSESEKEFALNSVVEYAPHPYIFISPAKATKDGLTMVSEGKETPLAELPEWEEAKITGYGCLDHFDENDVFNNSWHIYGEILKHPSTSNIILDIGMPVLHKSNRYNCRMISYNGQILLIRPKLYLANNGNYREMRYFSPWLRPRHHEVFQLPECIKCITGQSEVPIGDCVIQTDDTRIGAETCEELFTPQSPHISMALDGVEIFTNSSGSHHELRKLDTRLELISEATKKCGGVYLYANQRGCDGDRLYYDGCACIIVNGKMVAQGSQFSLKDVEVVTATIDLDDVKAYRNQKSAALQSVASSTAYHSIPTHFKIASNTDVLNSEVRASGQLGIKYHAPEEEIALGPACWLWDYLRRSRTGGFFLPLSGGIDSCATAVIVHSMCRLVSSEIDDGNEQVLDDLRALIHDEGLNSVTPQEVAAKLFYTSFMGTSNSSLETRERARDLAHEIGSNHVDLNMDSLVSAVIKVFEVATGRRPIFKVFGGSQTENLALQNIQARLRMVLSYLFAQLLPWTKNRVGGLLVLGSANVDECLRGYLTKYDCSSADINPIGGISKTDLKKFISWASAKFSLPILHKFLEATPTAELEPITEDYVQSDEIDMGMSYLELSRFGKLRKVENCGPESMFVKLYHEWSQPPFNYSAATIADKVKRFWFFYAVNRHKMTTMTPSYHAEQYSPDDNRFDLRPFLINPRFPLASKNIDQLVKNIEKFEGN